MSPNALDHIATIEGLLTAAYAVSPPAAQVLCDSLQVGLADAAEALRKTAHTTLSDRQRKAAFACAAAFDIAADRAADLHESLIAPEEVPS